jgi:hypothetical protein
MAIGPNVEILLNELTNIPAGEISGEMAKKIRSLLADCWHEVHGGTAHSTTAEKLRGRAENLRWYPPFLDFTLERHGPTVLGSSRAPLHEWRLDFETATATCDLGGYRQLSPTAPKVDVKPLVAEAIAAVREGPAWHCELAKSGLVLWKTDDEVWIMHGRLIPNDGYARTIAGRRRRFRKQLIEQMKADGWTFVEVRRAMIFRKNGIRRADRSK